jgi:hypothetical protein
MQSKNLKRFTNELKKSSLNHGVDRQKKLQIDK